MTRKVILYPGSFCPPTIGHSDLVERAALHYDKVIWAIGVNPLKNYLFSVEERLDMMQHIVDEAKKDGLENIVIESFEGAAIRYAESTRAGFILRGLRNTSDLQFELEMATANRGMCKNIETICMFAKPHFATLSSSLVRDIAFLGEKIDQYVHPYVATKLQEKVRQHMERASIEEGVKGKRSFP